MSTYTDPIVPNTQEIIASQQATIGRLIDFTDAQGREIVALKAQLDAAQKQNAEAKAVLDRGTALIDSMAAERDAAKMALLEAEAKCAELRRIVESLCWHEQRRPSDLPLVYCVECERVRPEHSPDCSISRALSTDLAHAKEAGLNP